MKGKALKIVNLILAVFLALFSVGYAFAWFATSTSQKSGVTGSAGAYFASGSGTEADPFVITNAQHLSNLAALQAAGKLQQKYYFELGNDIDMSGRVVPPIGTADNPFIGDFDGNGHTVSGLVVSTNKNVLINGDVYSGVAFSNFVGMFGRTGEGSDIRNFILNNPVVEAASEGATYADSEGTGNIVLGEGNSVQVSQAVGLAVGYIEHRASSIGVIGGVISAPRSGYNTFNGIIGAMSEEAGNSYDLGSDGNLGTIGNVGYFIPDIFAAAADRDLEKLASNGNVLFNRLDGNNRDMKANKMLFSSNGITGVPMGYTVEENAAELIKNRWDENADRDFSTNTSLGLGVFTFVTATENNDMAVRPENDSLLGKDFNYSRDGVTYTLIRDYPESGHDENTTKWEGYVRNIDGSYITDATGEATGMTLGWQFRYRGESGKLDSNNLDLIMVDDAAEGGAQFVDTGYDLFSGTNSTFTNFPTNALVFNTVINNASIFVIHSTNSVYVQQILDGQTLVNRLRFKAAKELNDSGIDFTQYANFEQYAAADANAASYLESNYGHIDGTSFYMKYDYDILYNTTAISTTATGVIKRTNNGYTGDQIMLNQGTGLYVMFSDSSNLNIQYVAVTGVAGEESADQPGIANAAVSGIDFIYDGVIITQEPVYSGATAIDAFAFAVQSGSMYERYVATATLVYITGNSSAAVILGFVRSTDGGPLNVGYKIEGQNDLVPSQTSSSAQITADGDIGVTVSASGAVVTGWPNSTATG